MYIQIWVGIRRYSIVSEPETFKIFTRAHELSEIVKRIPLEFWPKCFWCAGRLGDSTLEVNTGFDKRRICIECQNIVEAIIHN